MPYDVEKLNCIFDLIASIPEMDKKRFEEMTSIEEVKRYISAMNSFEI